MPKYAENTTVSPEKSRSEIEAVLRRYGVDGFMFAWEGTDQKIEFKYRGLLTRLQIALPDRNSDEFRLTPSKRWQRTEQQQDAAYEQAIRQRWRSLLLWVKAQLEAIDSGIITFDQAFLPYLVLPGNNGVTVSDALMPGIYGALTSGETPRILEGKIRKIS